MTEKLQSKENLETTRSNQIDKSSRLRTARTAAEGEGEAGSVPGAQLKEGNSAGSCHIQGNPPVGHGDADRVVTAGNAGIGQTVTGLAFDLLFLHQNGNGDAAGVRGPMNDLGAFGDERALFGVFPV